MTAPRRISLGRAWDLLDATVPSIAEACPTIRSLTPAGDVRRYEPLVSQVLLVGEADDPASALNGLDVLPSGLVLVARGPRHAVVAHHLGDLEIGVTHPEEYGTSLCVATGSEAHLHALDRRGVEWMAHAREEDLYRQAGLAFIPPELRQASGEIDAAASGRLPVLVDHRDVRGDLHMHTTYSDGRDTVAEMVEACHALRYEYIAITDHSQGAAAGRTLKAREVPRQREELDRLQERFRDMAILHGVEVDILADGRLDFPDRVLEEFDIVLASLHDDAGHDGARLTKRCVEAMRHPLVTIVTHPANRLVGRHEGYDLDFDALYEAAAHTGTALEVDGAASHLDLDGERARAAAAAGVTLVIDSDCHRATQLERYMDLGVGTARRGWVEARQVLNTRPIAELRAFIDAKRR